MEAKYIIENNKLIAEFMRFDTYPITGKSDGYKVKFREGSIPVDTCAASLEFHTSWDWLMPVVEKIRSLGYNVQTDNGQVNIYDIDTYDEESGNVEPIYFYLNDGVSNFDNLYEGVISFIKWKNDKKATE